MIPLSAYRFVRFEGLTCYLYHGCTGPTRIPTVRDGRLDLINVWTYPHSTDEGSDATTLLSLESIVLADISYIVDILAIYMLLLVFILVKS
jgi:hypothetical protein